MFNWDDVRYFLTLQRQATLAAAGAALKLDPTTVGRRLVKLEEELGARLFDRTPAGYVLTEAGHRLLPRAERIEREALGVERDVAGEDQKLEGVVKLTATEMLTTRFIAPHLRRFRERYPQVQLDLNCTNLDVNLARREADIALRLARPTQEDLIIKRLSFIHLGLYASRDYVDRFGLPKDSLAGHQMILFASRRPFRRENDWVEARMDGAHVALRSDSVSAMYAATTAGTGIALLPCLVADHDRQLVRIPVEGGPEPRQIWQAVHKDLRDSARIRAVLDFLGKVLTAPQERISAA
ncbi:MAG: LysR family transcriptional regulator [Myxococcales bacterium]|nr:LysR family transcriptional regulator [Myxococcales bacterium]